MQVTLSCTIPRRLGWNLFRILCLVLFFTGAASAASGPAPAGAIGETTFVQGVASAQRGGEAPRFLAKGEPLYETDTISTGAKGFALITLKDGTKMTLRPGTVFSLEKFRHDAGEESALFKLVKGGVRALTGLVSKRNPRGVEFNTATATIGIRGTSFDARICQGDCVQEPGRGASGASPAHPELIVARVATLSGTVTATGPDNQSRPLGEGSALFTGDSVRTAKGSYAVLGFRDRSRVTVVSDSEFKLEDVRFTSTSGEDGNFAVRIVRGGVRALTGLLGKRNPKAVTFGISTATIGIRGTGFDAYLASACITPTDCMDGAVVQTWQDAVDFIAKDRSLAIENNRVGFYVSSRDLLTLLDIIPPVFLENLGPRPDQMDDPHEQLFAERVLATIGRGLFVGMREGDVILRAPGGFIYLSRDEAAFLEEGANVFSRVTPYPTLLRNDPIPTPETFDERTLRLLELLNPGDVICEIR